MNNTYHELGFLYIKNLLDEEQLHDIEKRVFYYSKNNLMKIEPKHPESKSIRNIFDDYAIKFLPLFEEYLNKRLIVSYSFCRFYGNGDILNLHRDVIGCDITVSITVSYEGENIWPIFLVDKQGNINRSIIEPGDCLLFEGRNLKHWRNKYKEGAWQIQLFLHYIILETEASYGIRS